MRKVQQSSSGYWTDSGSSPKRSLLAGREATRQRFAKGEPLPALIVGYWTYLHCSPRCILLAGGGPYVKRINGCHDSQADSYDRLIEANSGDYIRENYFAILDRVVSLLPPIPSSTSPRILDIGIGTGLLTERMPKGLALFGIDISPKMMDKVREKGLPVELRTGSFLDIPYQDGYFDGIVSTFAFHHLVPEEKEKAYLEMHRVLKPGGYIIIADFMFEDERQSAELADRFRAEGRTDMLEEFEEESFTYIDCAAASLGALGYTLVYERGSTLSWIIKAQKSRLT